MKPIITRLGFHYNSIDINIISSCKYLININVTYMADNSTWKSLFFYGSPTQSKALRWNHLARQCISFASPLTNHWRLEYDSRLA